MKSILFFVAVLLMSNGGAGAQCKEEVYEYVSAYKNIAPPSHGKVYFLHTNMRTVSRNAQESSKSMDIKIYRGENILVYETGNIDIYHDSIMSVMIIHPLKKIVIEKSKGGFEERNVDNLISAQLELIKNSDLISCYQDKQDKSIKTVVLQPTTAIQQNLAVDRLLISYNVEQKSIKHTEVYYTKDSDIKLQSIDYLESNYNYKGKVIKTAKESIFKTKGELLPKYSNYSIEKK